MPYLTILITTLQKDISAYMLCTSVPAAHDMPSAPLLLISTEIFAHLNLYLSVF